MDALEAIKNRRSIRKFKADPVDDQTLEKVMEAARAAPSWSNVQPCKFVVIRQPQIKGLLADSVRPHPALGSNPAANGIRNAPVVIVALAEKGLSGYFGNQAATDKGDAWYMLDAGIAMQNLVLAATALGLGTVHVGLFDEQKVRQILEVPDNFHIVEMTPLGYPEFWPNARPRKALPEIVFYEKFGQAKTSGQNG
jgi:nitroreductase